MPVEDHYNSENQEINVQVVYKSVNNIQCVSQLFFWSMSVVQVYNITNARRLPATATTSTHPVLIWHALYHHHGILLSNISIALSRAAPHQTYH